MTAYSYSGNAFYAVSSQGYAGYISGNVDITGTLLVGSMTYTSDRNLKADFNPVDGKDLLDRIDSLPITSWVFKSEPIKHHIGPMAQDFHAAFGLDGDDDKRIDVTDIAGVSLAAIQALHSEAKEKDVEIAVLKAQLAIQAAAMADQARTVDDIQRQYSAIQAALVELQRDRRVAHR